MGKEILGQSYCTSIGSLVVTGPKRWAWEILYCLRNFSVPKFKDYLKRNVFLLSSLKVLLVDRFSQEISLGQEGPEVAAGPRAAPRMLPTASPLTAPGPRSLGLLQGPSWWPQPGTRGEPGSLAGGAGQAGSCTHSSWGPPARTGQGSPAESHLRARLAGAGSAGTLAVSFPLGPYEPRLPCRPWRGCWFAVCVSGCSLSTGAQKPPARAFSGRGAAPGAVRARAAVLGHRLHQPAGASALPHRGPGAGPPLPWCPGLHPRWEEQTQSFTLDTEGCLFFVRGQPVFWFSYVLESHKLKTGHFPDLIQVTCRLSPCVPSGGAVLRLESVCAAGQGEWPAPPPPGLQTSARGRARRAFLTGARKPSLPQLWALVSR